MQEADYSTTQRAFEGRSADDRLMIKFEVFPHPNETKSLEQGRPIYDDREYITIIVPGDKNSIVHRPVWAQDKQRFARQYAAFQQGRSQDVSGTPLTMWGGMTLSQAKEFEYFNVKTVEQLAEMSDGNGVNVQGFNGLKQRAKDWVERTKSDAPLLQLRAEVEAKANDIQTMQQQLVEQGNRIDQLMKLIPANKLKQLDTEEAA